MAEMTVLYLTDSRLADPLATRVREVLRHAAGDCEVVSVSQQPLDYGRNIVAGDIGRSWLSIHLQLLMGLEACATPFVAVAEHDCFYTPEHFAWSPPSADRFYCNSHCWLVQWGGNHPELTGMYSYWPHRQAMSQTMCARELWLRYTAERVAVLSGVDPKDDAALAYAQAKARTSQPIHLHAYLKGKLTETPSSFFTTTLPNLDVRHGQNFTGAKRGKCRRYELPYWGTFADVMAGVSHA